MSDKYGDILKIRRHVVQTEKIATLLYALREACPEQRIGQIIENAIFCHTEFKPPVFLIEDDDLAEALLCYLEAAKCNSDMS